MSSTPPLKPWAYYRAVDLLERGRTAVRRRGPAPPSQDGVRILAYHRVSAERDPLAVAPDAFRRQMEEVLERYGAVTRLDRALDLLDEPVAEPLVCVTFDDGYRDTLDVAAPILRELGVPATVYLPTAMIDGRAGYDWYRQGAPPAMGWDEVAELVADGLIDVGSHTRTHPCLPALDDRRAREELVGSKADIEARLGRPVTSFCYPAGLYGPRDAGLVREAGYRGGLTCRSGLNRGAEEMAELRRTLVGWADDDARFRAKLDGRLDVPGRGTELMQRLRARGGSPSPGPPPPPPADRRGEPIAYSGMLITKDRPARAAAILDQIVGQTRRPARMVVVDASTPPLEYDDDRVAAAAAAGIELVVVHEPPSMPHQRNRGVELVETPVTLVLDDDVVLAPDYMECLLERWEARGLNALGGVVGSVRQGSHFKQQFPPVERTLRRLFFLHDIAPTGATRLRRSGKLHEVLTPTEDVLVPVFGNAALAYRTDLLRKHRFDEQFSGYVYGEDLDLTGRLARDAPILHSPSTWYIHEWEPAGRATGDLWYRRARQEGYFRLRLIGRSPLSLAAFALSVVGELGLATAQSLQARRMDPVRGYLRGMRETIRATRAESRRRAGDARS